MRQSPSQARSMPGASVAESWKMFDRIAERYDLLNRLLSFRRDVAWRKFLYEKLPEGTGLRVLDLATGTGDVLLGLAVLGDKVSRGVGLDKSAKMLALGRQKAGKRGLLNAVKLLRGDASALCIKGDSFDAATMAFGIRNVPDVPRTLREIRRILKPGGRVLILEFSLPRNRIIRGLYLFYFRNILTRVGAFVSRDRHAYRYLNRTAEEFPRGEAFCSIMREAGFRNVQHHPLTFGVATLYEGDK